MSEGKRIRRTPEQIVADLDVQIEKLKDSILELENKKAAAVTEFDNKIAAVKEKIAKLEAASAWEYLSDWKNGAPM